MDLVELSMILETIEAKEVSQDEFLNAVQSAKQITTLDNDQQLLLYALFKQSTVGNVNVPEPNKSDIAATYKWKTWKSFEGFPQKNAALAYVYVVTQLLSGKAFGKGDTNRKEDESGGEPNGMGAIVSTLFYQYDESMSWSESEAVFKAVVDNDAEKLRECIATGVDLNRVNEEGMTPLHFAADRGFNNLVVILLESGAAADVVDASGQTPLMNAVSCEYKDVVETLLSHGASVSVVNSEGVSVLGFEDVPSEIMDLLSSSRR